MAYDVRNIANFVLDISDEMNVSVSNVAINKIVYFLHCSYLLNKSKALVSAKIEAWPLGPVFRELYHEFKEFEGRPISKRASKIDINLAKKVIVTVDISQDDIFFLKEEISSYLTLSDNQLIALSHEIGGPWDQVWNHGSVTNASMRISDESINNWYNNTDRH